MTREEAKELLLHILMTYEPKDQYGDYDDPEPYEQALTMAIEALQTIDNCDQCKWCCPSDGTPTIHVVRCKDCRHLDVWNLKNIYAVCSKHGITFEPFEDDTRTHFCAWGERREE